MTKKNEIKVLPSKVILSNGSIVTLDELKENDKEIIKNLLISEIQKKSEIMAPGSQKT